MKDGWWRTGCGGHAGGVEVEVRRLDSLVFLKFNYVAVVSLFLSNVI